MIRAGDTFLLEKFQSNRIASVGKSDRAKLWRCKNAIRVLNWGVLKY
jgi:hypothetical protein